MSESVGAILVIGGGIAGIQAALDCADMGYKVYLVEKGPSIGGHMAQLDKTFPTNDCSMCILAPKMVEVANHPNIELLTYSVVAEVAGEAGNFAVKVVRKPRYVDETKCRNCGSCAEKCPKKVKDEFNMGLDFRKSVYIPFPQAIPPVYLIDPQECLYLTKGVCKVCEKRCEAEAINYEDKEKVEEINVGSIIVTSGYDMWDPSVERQYHYEENPNILTSLEFERVMSASGPYGGHIVRPSDKQKPKRIAWLQCIGSRDERYKEYCSAVCCMYAIKQSILVKDHYPEIECQIFYMDMRTFGKGFYEFQKKAEEMGVEFTRCRIGTIIPGEEQICIRYEPEDDKIEERNFDLVILSTALSPNKSLAGLSKTLGIEVNNFGYCESDQFYPVRSTRPGIYLAGACMAPQDIPDSIIMASGAAAEAAGVVPDQRHTLSVTKEYPPELGYSESEQPRVGVFICHCGINIARVVDVKEVVEFAKTLPNVAFAEDNLYMCSRDATTRIQNLVTEHNLSRVVVASCTPRTHEPLFQASIREAGLNKYLFEMANIREHCSWVHPDAPEKATKKAKDLVAMAVAKAGLLRPLEEPLNDLIQVCAVIGGGIAGLTASLEVAKQGFPVLLIEKEKEFGGIMRHIYFDEKEDKDPQKVLKDTIEAVKTNDKIQIFLNKQIKEIEGFVGNFTLTLEDRDTKEIQKVKSGTIIIASGGAELTPSEYLYGQNKQVIRQSELEALMVSGKFDAKLVVMIQCVGSRQEARPYCSRICCTEALKNAIRIRKTSPSTRVIILYKEITSYAFKELLYRKARELGVIFIHYEDANPPKTSEKDGKLVVSVYDSIIKRYLKMKPDYLVLSVAIIPNEGNEELSKMLKVPLGKHKFFLEAHVKLRPNDFSTAGIFLCGLAHSPRGMNETITQAMGAAGRACTLLSNDKVKGEPITAEISKEDCIGCALCTTICPFEAIILKQTDVGKRAEVIKTMCKGCGTCGSTCPQRAIIIPHFTDKEIISQLKAGLITE